MPGNKKNRRKEIQKAKRAEQENGQKRRIMVRPDKSTGKLALALLVAHAVSNKPTY